MILMLLVKSLENVLHLKYLFMVPIRKSFQIRSTSVGEDLATLLLIIIIISILDKVKKNGILKTVP